MEEVVEVLGRDATCDVQPAPGVPLQRRGPGLRACDTSAYTHQHTHQHTHSPGGSTSTPRTQPPRL
jgi:hypothetical protein